jgi:kinesin family protein 3/17
LEDKDLAIRLLEERSKEYEKYEQEHENLTQKLQYLESKLLIGGRKIEETPQFKVILEEKSKLIQMEYENKLMELDKEKRSVEEEKMLVERYKQLLLKQRDIMIALTSRLNERDETIIALQEDLDTNNKHYKELEDANNDMFGRIAYLEGKLQESGVNYDKSITNHKNTNKNNKGIDIKDNNTSDSTELRAKDEQILKMKDQLDERNRAESLCLKDLLNIVKNYTDSNDR